MRTWPTRSSPIQLGRRSHPNYGAAKPRESTPAGPSHQHFVQEILTAKSVAQVLHHRLLVSEVRNPQLIEGPMRSSSPTTPTPNRSTGVRKT
jgi:hypothetical protein